jgi:hypothetical protein
MVVPFIEKFSFVGSRWFCGWDPGVEQNPDEAEVCRDRSPPELLISESMHEGGTDVSYHAFCAHCA